MRLARLFRRQTKSPRLLRDVRFRSGNKWVDLRAGTRVRVLDHNAKRSLSQVRKTMLGVPIGPPVWVRTDYISPQVH